MGDTNLKQTTINHLKFIEGSFISVLDSFLIDRLVKNLSKYSIRYYRNELNQFNKWLEQSGYINIQDITPEIIKTWILSIQTKRNPGGVHASYRAIKALFNWYEFEYEPAGWKNPIKKVKIKNPKIEPLPGIPIGDIEKMVEVCKSPRDKAILCCLLDTGCRAAEFLKLNIEDIDLVTGSIRVIQGKGGKTRMVFIESKSRKYLRQYLKTREDNNPAVWLTDEKTRLTYDGLRQIIKRRSIDAGVPIPGLHDFRRAFTLNFIRNGGGILTASRLLGHSSMEVTKRYIALTDSDLAEEHRKYGPVDHSKL
jgi:integrase/recombinase XerD